MCAILQSTLFFIFLIANRPGLALEINRFRILDDDYQVEWRADLQTKNITFSITAKTLGFVGFGLSPMGGMKNADIIIGGIKDGKPYFADYYAKGKQTPDVDASQDWELLAASENCTHTALKVTRIFNTCDHEDVPINNDTTKIIWAIGATDDIVQHRKRGSASVNLLDSAAPVWNGPESDIWHINVKTKLPADDTIYWCTAHKSPPFDVKRHVVGFGVKLESKESRTHTHHLILHHCVVSSVELQTFYENMLRTPGDHCYNPNYMFIMKQTCQQYMYGWAVGGDPLFLPENIGIPLNELGFPEYFLLEVHYDNPDKLAELHYNTGIDVYTTTSLREHEAGIIRIGYETDIGLMIPPNTSNYVIVGHCSGICTDDRLPDEGINVFSVILHSHLAGRKMKLRQFRNGVELPWLAYDENYDFNFQQNRILPEHKQIFKGDQLTFECVDDSSDRSPPEAILGGLSTRREMCLTFVMYYPRISTLDNCGSYFGEGTTLLTKLGIESVQPLNDRWDVLVTAPPKYANKLYSEILSKEIPWSDNLKLEVQNLTRFGEHEVNCDTITQTGVNMQAKVTYPEFKPYIPKNECEEDSIIMGKN